MNHIKGPHWIYAVFSSNEISSEVAENLHDKNLRIKVNIKCVKGHNFRPIIRKCCGYAHLIMILNVPNEVLLKCSELHVAQNLDLQDKPIQDFIKGLLTPKRYHNICQGYAYLL